VKPRNCCAIVPRRLPGLSLWHGLDDSQNGYSELAGQTGCPVRTALRFVSDCTARFVHIPQCVMASVCSGRLHVARWTTHIGRISAYAFLLPFPSSHQNPSTIPVLRACDETHESSWSSFVFPIFPIVLLESGVRSRSPSVSFALLDYCLIAYPSPPRHLQDCPALVARRDTYTLWPTNSLHHRFCWRMSSTYNALTEAQAPSTLAFLRTGLPRA